MGNWISNRNQTTRNNTNASTSPPEFYERGHYQRIDIHELGGVGAFNDFMEHLGNVWGELKHEEGMKGDVTGSKSLIRGHRIERNSADN